MWLRAQTESVFDDNHSNNKTTLALVQWIYNVCLCSICCLKIHIDCSSKAKFDACGQFVSNEMKKWRQRFEKTPLMLWITRWTHFIYWISFENSCIFSWLMSCCMYHLVHSYTMLSWSASAARTHINVIYQVAPEITTIQTLTYHQPLTFRRCQH